MPKIKPIADLQNYATVLKDISSRKLMIELEKGRISGEKEGWHTLEEIRKEFGIGK